MLQVNDKVMVNMPATACGVVNAKSMRKFNHRVATVTEVGEESCKLSIDDGKYEWPHSLLAVPVALS